MERGHHVTVVDIQTRRPRQDAGRTRPTGGSYGPCDNALLETLVHEASYGDIKIPVVSCSQSMRHIEISSGGVISLRKGHRGICTKSGKTWMAETVSEEVGGHASAFETSKRHGDEAICIDRSAFTQDSLNARYHVVEPGR